MQDENENITKDQAIEYLKSLANKDIENIETGIKAQINSEQRNKIISLTALNKSQKNGFTANQHNAAAARIDKLFKHATQLESNPDKSGDKNIVSIKRFAAPILIKNEIAAAYITVKESIEKGHRIYSLELQEIKKLPHKGGTLQERTTVGVKEAPT